MRKIVTALVAVFTLVGGGAVLATQAGASTGQVADVSYTITLARGALDFAPVVTRTSVTDGTDPFTVGETLTQGQVGNLQMWADNLPVSLTLAVHYPGSKDPNSEYDAVSGAKVDGGQLSPLIETCERPDANPDWVGDTTVRSSCTLASGPFAPRGGFNGPCGDPFYRAWFSTYKSNAPVRFSFNFHAYPSGALQHVTRLILNKNVFVRTPYYHVLGSSWMSVTVHYAGMARGTWKQIAARKAAPPGNYGPCA